MRSTFLPFSPPLLGEEEIAEVVDTLRSDWLTTGPKVKQFETAFAEAVGAPAALALNSCTSALHVALALLGVGPGDEVISTPMTFTSSIHVIEHLGARPVLVDVEPDTLNIDPGLVEAAISPKTRAILPVHLYGHPVDLDRLDEIASGASVPLVEDAAHALPAAVGGRTIGSPRPGVESLVAFSFYATKNLTTGEGGMLTASPRLVEEGRVWSLHGMSRDAFKRYTSEGSWHYDVVRPGFKYNMPDIQAAIGLRQLDRLGDLQARRRAVVERYDAAFADLPEVDRPVRRPGVEHAWHIYALRLNLDRLAIDRARFIEELRSRNIGASVHFIPIHFHTYYRERYGFNRGDFPVTEREYERLVSLPLSPRMTEADADDVADAVRDIVAAHRR